MTQASRTEWVGLRVARIRTIAGMTQQTLADHAGVSRNYITMIEAGDRAVTKRSTLYALAESLGVSATDLTGQPYPVASVDDLTLYAAVPGLRAALDGPDVEVNPRSVAELEAVADQVRVDRMACDFVAVARALPSLVAELSALASGDSSPVVIGDQRRWVLAALVKALVSASLTYKPFGHVDLGMRLAERAQAVATELGDPVHLAAARYAVAQSMLAGGSQLASFRLAEWAGDQLLADATGTAAGDDNALTWRAMLHLHAALAGTAAGVEGAGAAHLDEAAWQVRHIRADNWRMEPTPANVGIWRVSVALENGVPETAPALVRAVDSGAVRSVQRRSRLYIETGRAYYAVGDPSRAVSALLLADDLAPREVRDRPALREIVGQMTRDARTRTGDAALVELGRRMSIDPLNPLPSSATSG